MDTEVRRVSPSSTPLHRTVPQPNRDSNGEHGSFEEALGSEGREEEADDANTKAGAKGRGVSPPLDDESGGRLNVVG